MIEEAYCSYEVSKLLKEKGFDENCRYHYLSKTSSINYNGLSYNNSLYDEVGEGKIAAPTQQMAMRWLREEKHICIEPYCIDQKFMCGFAKFPECTNIECHQSYGEYATYEEAIEAAVKYVCENLL